MEIHPVRWSSSPYYYNFYAPRNKRAATDFWPHDPLLGWSSATGKPRTSLATYLHAARMSKCANSVILWLPARWRDDPDMTRTSTLALRPQPNPITTRNCRVNTVVFWFGAGSPKWKIHPITSHPSRLSIGLGRPILIRSKLVAVSLLTSARAEELLVGVGDCRSSELLMTFLPQDHSPCHNR